MQVDFLILAALQDEAREIERLLLDVQHQAELVVGSILRWKGTGKYTVGLIDLFGMGNINALGVTQDAIGCYRPRAVLMTGIAAGFEDGHAKVRLGDLMVPYGIIPYEHGKIGAPKGRLSRAVDMIFRRNRAEVEHRGMAWAVSESLWRTAANTARVEDRPWLRRMTVSRPDGSANIPHIHAIVDSVIGCGEKVIAHKDADARKWLLASYPRQSLGLEMESFGALSACRKFDTPFLIAKASVDKATITKDDRWRTYACQLSASFLITVLERYERPVTTLVARHRQECEEAAAGIRQRIPKTDFQYKLQTAPSFYQLRDKFFDSVDREISELLPTDLFPVVVLYGGGGTGKTTIVRRLFCMAVQSNSVPVMVDLKRFASGEAGASRAGDELIDRIIPVCTVPRRSTSDISYLAQELGVLLIIDGVNEISKEARAALFNFCQTLQNSHVCKILLTNRLSALDGISGPLLHATVDKVPLEVARGCFNGAIGAGKFEILTPRLQLIMLRPFFLDLAIRSGRTFAGNNLWSGIFAEFFREHRSLSEDEIDQLATSTRRAMSTDGRLISEVLRKSVPATVMDKLLAAEVRVLEGTGGFEHHLWRDYLLARAIKLDPQEWTEDTYDAATSFGASPESLSMAMEQLDKLEEKIKFIKTVYDWNYTVTLECLAHSDSNEDTQRQLPEFLRQAVVAVVAEKLFDPVPRTADRTKRLLSQYSFTKEYVTHKDRKQLARHVEGLRGDTGWFTRWQTLFVKDAGIPVTDDDVKDIAANDSLIGWTAANFARRGVLSIAAQERVRTIYREHSLVDLGRSIRWRVVHALGRWPLMENVLVLADALLSDTYHWVSYGAARSLLEIAARSDGPTRHSALEAVYKFIATIECGGELRHLILQEMIETSFVKEASANWRSETDNLFEAVLKAEAHAERRRKLVERINTLRQSSYEVQQFDPISGQGQGE